jgi:hypothetical protein
MLRVYEQILQDNLQRIRDVAGPSPVEASTLEWIEHVRRNEERARSLGFVFPEEFQNREVGR